jgi:guanylate kinase
MLNEGHDVVLEIDWQGAQLIKKRRPDAISIFILPPTIEDLRERLENRGQDTQEVIDARMKKSINEISHYGEADYLVINDDFEDALKCLKTIVRAHRLETAKQAVINAPIIKKLLS